MKFLSPLFLLLFVSSIITAQSWELYKDMNGFITDIEYHNGQRYTTFKTGEVLREDSIIKVFPVQNFQETGLLSICFWQDSLCVVASGLDSIQRVICGTDTLLQVSYKSPWSIRHRAGDMVAVDSVLYAAFGDGSNPNAAQSLTDFRGKIMAITSDTTYIFAYGLRNPWKIDTLYDHLFIADVGNQKQEEIDFISLDSIGKNFGWPCYEGTYVHDSTYSCDPTKFPVYTYPRASVGNGIIGGKLFQNRFWWCDNFYQFGGMTFKNGATDSIPCPQYPDGMYIHGDTIFVYDYTGKIYRWDIGGPLSLDSIPPKEEDPYATWAPLVITKGQIRWTEHFDGEFSVFNIDGYMMARKDGWHLDYISTEDYPPGIYAIVFSTRHGIQWSKLFVVIN